MYKNDDAGMKKKFLLDFSTNLKSIVSLHHFLAPSSLPHEKESEKNHTNK